MDTARRVLTTTHQAKDEQLTARKRRGMEQPKKTRHIILIGACYLDTILS
jgi:hypothetical protein